MSAKVRIRNGMTNATEGDLRGIASDMVTTPGVADVAGGQLAVAAASPASMNVVVAAGVGYVPNTAFDSTDDDSVRFWEVVIAGTTGARTVAIASNSSGSTRIDLICVKIDPVASPDANATDVAQLIRVAGTPGAGVPATPSYHLKLAEVTVANGAVSISTGNITDSRTQARIAERFLPSNNMNLDSDQTVTGIKTFNSAKLLATRPRITTSIDDSAGGQILKTPTDQLEVMKGVFQGFQSYSPAGAGTATLDFSLGNHHRITMPAGNITIAFSNTKVGEKIVLDIIQDGTGGRTVTWPSGIKWPNNVVPTLSTGANKIDTFVLVCTTAGSAYQGYIAGQNL